MVFGWLAEKSGGMMGLEEGLATAAASYDEVDIILKMNR